MAPGRGMNVRAVLFDVDFTIARPGPELGPEGYQRLGRRFGLELDPARYSVAREQAIEGIRRHPELEHDEEIWVAFTERIIRNMGGDSDSAYKCAVAMTRAWEHAEHFELYEDALPVLEQLRAHGLKLGLVSNTGRDLDAFVAHHGLQVDAVLGSRSFGRTKPHPTIFQAVLERLGVEPADAAMVGDSPEDDVDGARAAGIETAFLLDRDERYPELPDRLPNLYALPAALGLRVDQS
jgi:HAD superfamily hydrolase (TIGR01549 family)